MASLVVWFHVWGINGAKSGLLQGGISSLVLLFAIFIFVIFIACLRAILKAISYSLNIPKMIDMNVSHV